MNLVGQLITNRHGTPFPPGDKLGRPPRPGAGSIVVVVDVLTDPTSRLVVVDEWGQVGIYEAADVTIIQPARDDWRASPRGWAIEP